MLQGQPQRESTLARWETAATEDRRLRIEAGATRNRRRGAGDRRRISSRSRRCHRKTAQDGETAATAQDRSWGDDTFEIPETGSSVRGSSLVRATRRKRIWTEAAATKVRCLSQPLGSDVLVVGFLGSAPDLVHVDLSSGCGYLEKKRDNSIGEASFGLWSTLRSPVSPS